LYKRTLHSHWAHPGPGVLFLLIYLGQSSKGEDLGFGSVVEFVMLNVGILAQSIQSFPKIADKLFLAGGDKTRGLSEVDLVLDVAIEKSRLHVKILDWPGVLGDLKRQLCA
jgi:hypothetical protein